MTIYSQHPNRGKIQILATYEGAAGTTSTTVTSLASSDLAAPIVNALNRISALATIPVSVRDTRDGKIRHYPSEHLVALTDAGARAALLTGTHSLWYEHVKLLLHGALADLDDALAKVPAPVGKAITAELEEEAHELRGELAYYAGKDWPESETRRRWDSTFPFVLFDGGMPDLAGMSREFMDRREEGITAEQRERAIADLRVLATAYLQCHATPGFLESEFEIFHEPDRANDHYLTVNLPQPGDDADVWRVDIGHWVPDEPQDDSFTGHTLLTCACPVPPTVADIVNLLDRSENEPKLLEAWANTPVGTALAGTSFIVTERHTV
ncbi:hypothetical protein Sru01_04420 [Sphaerisporangium rufum]|uniref:Uncharacterized protein n=1 Tax=Sphaerisporangium rufum TaxID=1381558 RepID=A0A919QZ34_9ACTN|nr:hypothetical protein [Sphaerisporangium rufum]GII75460.1 hypothetical protein Sru01_04420 [Sphaerisporangium rufum]